MKQKYLFIVIFFVFLLHFLFRVIQNVPLYMQKHDPRYWEDRYLASQWVIPLSENPIGDDGLYTHTAWAYINGVDPILLNPEVPFLGKYLIGSVIVIFKNQHVFGLITGILALSSMYLMNRKIVKNRLLAFLPVALLSFEPLFYSQMSAPFLDLLYMSFLFLSFSVFLSKRYFLAAFFFGCMISTKGTHITFFLVSLAQIAYLLFSKQTVELKKYTLSLPIVLLVYFFSYLVFFLHGHGLLDFLRVQKYIVNFYASGAKGDVLSFWHMIMSGKWFTWWGEIRTVSEWSILWPILFTFSLICSLVVIFRFNEYGTLRLIVVWFCVYTLYLIVFPLFPRYLLLSFPFMYNLIVWSFPHLRSTNFR